MSMNISHLGSGLPNPPSGRPPHGSCGGQDLGWQGPCLHPPRGGILPHLAACRRPLHAASRVKLLLDRLSRFALTQRKVIMLHGGWL